MNYRREDTAGHAGRLYDDLVERFGADSVFMDIDAIPPGVDFADAIEQAIGSAQAFLALIGPRWIGATDEAGRRRLDQPDDFVRLEIEAALGSEMLLIPVLFQGVPMPGAEQLPPTLGELTRRNAFEIRSSSSRCDVDRQSIRRLEEATARAGVRPRRLGCAGAPRPSRRLLRSSGGGPRRGRPGALVVEPGRRRIERRRRALTVGRDHVLEGRGAGRTPHLLGEFLVRTDEGDRGPRGGRGARGQVRYDVSLPVDTEMPAAPTFELELESGKTVKKHEAPQRRSTVTATGSAGTEFVAVPAELIGPTAFALGLRAQGRAIRDAVVDGQRPGSSPGRATSAEDHSDLAVGAALAAATP